MDEEEREGLNRLKASICQYLGQNHIYVLIFGISSFSIRTLNALWAFDWTNHCNRHTYEQKIQLKISWGYKFHNKFFVNWEFNIYIELRSMDAGNNVSLMFRFEVGNCFERLVWHRLQEVANEIKRFFIFGERTINRINLLNVLYQRLVAFEIFGSPMVTDNFIVQLNWVFVVRSISIIDCTFCYVLFIKQRDHFHIIQ